MPDREEGAASFKDSEDWLHQGCGENVSEDVVLIRINQRQGYVVSIIRLDRVNPPNRRFLPC